jgi:putative MATE family efflux protein
MKFAVDPKLGRRILVLAGPVVLAMVSQTAINIVDHILVGRLPADQSIPGQAAIGLSMILYWAIGGMLSAISVGTQALTARRYGAEQFEAAGQVMSNSLIISALSSTVFTVACYLSIPHIFPFFHKDPIVIRLGVPYLQWRMLGLFSMVTTISYKSWFDGLGKTHVHMVSAITMNVLNFFLNVALIYGKWGFPAWGVTGSAIASMASSYVGLALMIIWSLLRRYRFQYKNYGVHNLSTRQQFELVKLSLPSGIATLFVMSGFALFYKIVGMLDASAGQGSLFATATWNIIIILMAFFTGSIAYGTATATLVGQSMGAKQYDLAERYGWEAVKIGAYVTAVIGALVIFFPDTVLHAFTKDVPVIEVARPILRICGALLPVVLSALVLTQALFGAGNTTFVMIVEFVLHFTCLVPLAYVCGVKLGWGVLGVWMGAFAYILLLCSIMAWKFAEGRWKEIEI